MSDNRRDQLIEFVEREFIGPDPIDWPGMTQSNGQEILASDPPRTRYIAGILYPAETTDDKADLKDDECELLGESDGEDVEVKPQKLGDGIVEFLEDAEELINRSNAYRQSAISITVSVKDGDAIRVAVSAGTYTKVPAMDPATGERLENKYKYPRTALAWKNDNAPLILPTPTDGLKKFPIGTTGLQFDITYRYRTDDSCIYTFTLENAKPKVKENVSDEECFFQCKFKLFSEKGFSPLSDSQRITQDEDYQSNQLLYRNVRNYAIGHGCAADWDDSESVLWITTAIFPKYDIKPIVPSAIKGVSLDMLKMSPYGSFADTIRELRMMCAKYREWINGLRTIRQDLSTEYKITADRHITNCETCLSRMEKGVELLEQNENIRIAFQYMNLAMLMQQLHYNLPLQKWEDNGAGDISLVNPVSMPVVTDDSTWHNKEQRVYGKWRPFQLAFVLMNLRAMYDRDCNERGIVDLIWFPTGGGKTEAYLGLSAYTIFIRRLMNKDDKGTAKLLDCQQFERKVPIYLPDGGYIEQLGFETVRKSLNPPWQSSIRPLSQEAYDYILKAAGIQLSSEPVHQDSIDVLKDKLKLAVRDFYVEGNSSAIHRIESIASAIGRATSTSGKENEHTKSSRYSPTVSQVEKLSCLLDYCKTMRMSYSYKPILILALLHYGDRDGCISIENATVYFREYYSNRKAQGLAIEKKQCIYLRDDVTDAQIIANLLSNPVKALIESGFFFYNEDAHVFSVSPDIWSTIDISNKAAITRICRQKLKDYYKD